MHQIGCYSWLFLFLSHVDAVQWQTIVKIKSHTLSILKQKLYRAWVFIIKRLIEKKTFAFVYFWNSCNINNKCHDLRPLWVSLKLSAEHILTNVLCALHFCVFESEKWDFHTALSNTLLLICRKILIIDTLYSSFIYLVNYLFIYLFIFWLRKISLELTSVPVFLYFVCEWPPQHVWYAV